MNYKLFSLLFGFSVWLMATLAFRFWGHTFFYVENTLLMVGFFLSTIPSLYLTTTYVFKKYNLSQKQRFESAILLAIPGMLCDVICLNFHEIVFPTLSIEQSVVLGAWIIWAYVIVLFIGLFSNRLIKPNIKKNKVAL
ncbi:DUF5367 domain-containing protein [Winogradskyella sp.]